MEEILKQIRNLQPARMDSNSLILNAESEKFIQEVLVAEQQIKAIKEAMKIRLLDIARLNPKLKRYEGDRVKIGFSKRTTKKIHEEMVSEKFVKLEKKPNTQAIDDYFEEFGKLPEGVEEQSFEYISFKLLE